MDDRKMVFAGGQRWLSQHIYFNVKLLNLHFIWYIKILNTNDTVIIRGFLSSPTSGLNERLPKTLLRIKPKAATSMSEVKNGSGSRESQTFEVQ
jgi:hypothetical protein